MPKIKMVLKRGNTLDQATHLRNIMRKEKYSRKDYFNSSSSLNDQNPKDSYSNENSTVRNSKIITITSGKGGVGKTSLSVNIGIALAKAGKKVLLFDADLGLANINVLLGIVPKYNLYHVIKRHKTLQEVIIQTTEGLHLIPGASGYSLLADLPENEREHILNAFKQIGPYDIILIDTGAGVGQNVVGFTNTADEVYIVTTPEPTAITDAYGIIKSIILYSNNKNINLIVNRASSAFEGKKVADRILHICQQFLNTKIKNAGFVYDDENVRRSIKNQKPFYLAYPKSKATNCLNIIVQRILKDTELSNNSMLEEKTLSSFFKKIFNTQ